MAQYDLVLTQNVSAGTDFTERYVTMAKGVLISANSSNVPTILAAGTNGYHLARDDAEVTGLKWVAVSGGVTPVDSPLLDWDGANSYYTGYPSADKAAGRLYYGNTTPSATTRLNFDGYIYATKLYVGTADVALVTGTPVDNQLGIWTNATTLEGSSALTFDGSILATTGTITLTGTTRTAGHLYAGTTNPSSATRLNYDGYLYGYEFITNVSSKYTQVGPGAYFVIYDGTNNNVVFQPAVADGAGAVAFTFSSETNLATAGAKIVSFRNANTEKAYLSKDGYFFPARVSWGTGITYITGQDTSFTMYLNSAQVLSVNSTPSWTFTGSLITTNSDGYQATLTGTMLTWTRNGGNQTIRGGSGGAGQDGDALYVEGGAAGTSGTGGALRLSGGAKSVGSAGGRMYFGDGGQTSGVNYKQYTAVTGYVLYFNEGTGEVTYGAAPSGGISWNGSTANAVATYGSASTIDAEANLTFDGSTLTLGTGADRTIKVGDTVSAAAYNLTIQAGTPITSGNYAGGHLYLRGGGALNTAVSGSVFIYGGTVSTAGNVNLAYDGSTSRGYVGIRVGANTSYGLYMSGNLGLSGNTTIKCADTVGVGGDTLTVSGGLGPTGYIGGHLKLTGGNAGSGYQAGHVYVYGGAGSGATVGNIYLAHDGTNVIGYVGIRVAPSSSYSLKVAGEIYSDDDMRAANFILNSDIRLKTNIVALKPEYLDIDYSQFEFKNKLGQARYGVIAQQVQEKYPDLVREAEGELAVAYVDLLVREIAYLKDKVKELEGRMN